MECDYEDIFDFILQEKVEKMFENGNGNGGVL